MNTLELAGATLLGPILAVQAQKRIERGNSRNLRTILITAALFAATIPAIAQIDVDVKQAENPSLKLMLCRSIKDDSARLKCFDESLD